MSKKEIIISSNPTVCLKSLNPLVIYTDYKNNKYSYFDLEYINIIKINFEQKLSNITSVGKDQNSDIFTKNNINNKIKVFCTDNCNFYNSFNLSDRKENSEEYKCFYCRRKFKGNPVGVPVSYEKFMSNDGLSEILVFHCVTCDCSMECSFSNIDTNLIPESQKSYSTTVLKYAFEKMYPGKTLNKALDWRLLKENGGSLDETEYTKNTHSYTKINTLIFSPIKNIYEKIKTS